MTEPPTVHTYESLIALIELTGIRLAYIEDIDRKFVTVHLQGPGGRYFRFDSKREEMLIYARIDRLRGYPPNPQKLRAAGSPGFWSEILDCLMREPESEQRNFPPLEEDRVNPYTMQPFKKGGPWKNYI